MKVWYEQAQARLKEEYKAVAGQKESAMKSAVRDALLKFCRQNEEFAQAVVQGGSFKDCMAAVAKGVGGYADRHMRGVTTILFLRRSSAPGTPYVTIEMDGNQIRQIHGYHNDTLPGSPKPREVHKEFLDTWLQWLRAGSKRNEDGTPKLPQRAVRKKQGVGAA